MNYSELTVGGNCYKLRLTTRGLVALEKTMGYNPLQLFMDIEDGKLPKLTDIALILQASISTYQHGFSMDKTYDLIDAFMEEGHGLFDMVPVLVDVFQNCGFVANSKADDEKNA